MDKFCLVAQGGGMVACYHVGVIAALKEKYGFEKVSRIIATSGAAATYAYLVSGQENLIRPIWTDLVKSGKFVNPWKFPIGKHVMSIDFLVDEMIKTKYPIDLQTFKNSPINFEVGVTDAQNGKPVFFSQKDSVDFFELLRASCSIPYFARGKVSLNENFYYDGTIGSVSGLEQASGEQNILVVLTRPPRPLKKFFLFRKMLLWLLVRNETPQLQEAIWNIVDRYDKVLPLVKKMQETKNIVVIQPRKKLPVLRIDTSLNRVVETIDQGYKDTIENKELERFFHKIP